MMFMGVKMDIQKEREAFEAWFLNKYQYSAEYFQITKFDADRGFYTAIDHYNPDSVNSAWVLRSSFDSWQAAKAQAVPEGFVLVPKEKISYFWQDNDEPENFCSNESDFDCLGDCIDLGEIIEINKFTQAHINKEKLFGTWFAEAIDPSEKANFFVGNHAECLEIVAKNKAMIEAQEQKVTEMKINWGMECPRCNHNEAIIHSTAEKDSGYEFMNGDAVNCLKCGNTGEMDANSEDSDIVWNEYEAQEQSHD